MTTPDDLVKLAREEAEAWIRSKNDMAYSNAWMIIREAWLASRIASQKGALQTAPSRVYADWLSSARAIRGCPSDDLAAQMLTAILFDQVGPASQTREPEWKGIDRAPYGGTVDAHLIDGSILCNAIRQGDDEWWWCGQFFSAYKVVGWRPSQAPVDAAAEPAVRPRFANVSCSQCGRDFGPGEHGFSHCDNHSGRTPK